MKVSQIGLTAKKISNLDSQFPVQDMLVQTGQLQQFSSGVYAFGHIPQLVRKNIDSVISGVLSKYDCSELSLPLLQPESIWKESGRLGRYVDDNVMFRCLNDKGNFCLAPTAEEAAVSYARGRLCSYKQLPVTYFQIGPKFRNELRPRGYLLRGRAFDMLDAYSFGRNQADLDITYDNMKRAFLEIFETLGLQALPVGADSGNIGGNKSEEFMYISDMGEDTILFDEQSGKAFNSELLDRADAREYLKETYGIDGIENLKPKKAVELGHIFQLGDKYAKAMDATYVDKNGNQQNFVMGCYGIGVSRTLAMVYERSIVRGENNVFKGIALPLKIAPYSLYIVPKFDDRDKTFQSLTAYKALIDNGVPVLYDDRPDISIGARIKDSKITGTPYVAVFGRTLDQGLIEVENNLTGEKISLTIEQFISAFTMLEMNKRSCSLEDIVNKFELCVPAGPTL